MKVFAIVLSILFLSGCTHHSISDVSLLENPNTEMQKRTQLQDFPMHLDAERECYKTREVNAIRTTCSNKGRIIRTVELFKEKGLNPIPAQENADAPKMTVKVESISTFLESTTGVINILTLGLSPLYHYDDYVVIYTDKANDVHIEETVRVSSYSSWFSLFMDNPKGLAEGDIKGRAEKNLVRSVIDKAKI